MKASIFLIFALWNTNSFAQELIPGQYIVRFESAKKARANIVQSFLRIQKSPPLAPSLKGRFQVLRSLSSSQKIFLIRDNDSVGVSVFSAAMALQGVEGIRYIEADRYVSIDFGSRPPKEDPEDPDPSENVNPLIPNDPRFSELWGLYNEGQTIEGSRGKMAADSRAAKVWEESVGDERVVVGIFDTGIDTLHPDLVDNLWSTVVDGKLVYGYNAMEDNYDVEDDNAHGTHVAGTIGAKGNNGVGVVGVNWTSSLMAVKFMDERGRGTLSDAIRAIDWGVDNGVQVMNHSWGSTGFSRALEESVERAREAGILFVAAAGNSSADNDRVPHYPSSYKADNIIAVGALDNQDQIASFSNYGRNSVHLFAPGVDILSTVPGGDYDYFSGTSMASPHVAGAAALLLSRNPQLRYLELKNRLLQNLRKMSILREKSIHGGSLDLFRVMGGI